MTPTPRALALVAVLALPVAAIVATLLLRAPAEPPAQTPVVRIGGADGSGGALPSLTPNQSRPTQDDPSDAPPDTPSDTANPKPTRDVVPPPPPVDDDDDDDDGDGDGADRDGDRDDGDDDGDDDD
ncbi:hypothetical protein [Prauserella rugosa]|uniref:Small secreted hydrophilic protein n=1 Tax=Prauserella rugosa TaxID=43354 RepID=A0A660CEY5_9PSEU|nr:hypothetical protein [Prauserella rugosa]TWH20069.1 hypothetical protein JD82_01909 [Prauserella rugosa]